MANMVPVPLADLIAPVSADDELTHSLELCQQLGLPTTAWQPIQMIPAVINVNAIIAADQSSVVSLVAQGGYASLAANMVDSSGNPITTWMQLRATDQYGITPGQASAATGNAPYTSTSATTYSYNPNNPIHFQNQTTGATYTSTGTGSVLAGGSGNIPFIADQVGSASTSGAGVTLVLLTPLAGVTIQPLVISAVGNDVESNQALLTRGQNKLTTLAPIQTTDQPGPVANGAAGCFDYVARTIPQGATSNAAPPYSVTSLITRTAEAPAAGYGNQSVYVANAAGAPGAADIAVVQAAIDALVTPEGVTVTVLAATPVLVGLTGVIYARASAGLTSTQLVTNAEDALAQYFAGLDIGGVTTTSANIVPLTEISDVVFDSSNSVVKGAIVDLVLTLPVANVYLGPSGVPESGTISLTVTFV